MIFCSPLIYVFVESHQLHLRVVHRFGVGLVFFFRFLAHAGFPGK